MSPIGDQGGSCAQLIITCEAVDTISKGDALTLVEDYRVRASSGNLFGQAMENAKSGDRFPVLVRGIAEFHIAKGSSKHHSKWRINALGELVPNIAGNELTVLYQTESRLDILL